MMPRFLSTALLWVLVCAAVLAGGAGRAVAQEPEGAPERRGEVPPPRGARVLWDPSWREFGTGEWVATGAGVSALLLSRILPQRSTHWQGGILFDEQVRAGLRVGSRSGRRLARDLSDVGIVINESWPFFDAMVVASWYRRSPELGWQQGLISAEVLAVTTGLQALITSAASRERPYGRDCQDPSYADSRDCTTSDRYRSFYSGHTSQSFAGAAVTCMHHAYVPLYGGGAADDWACVGALGVAASTALLRVATDVHYASDIAAGAVMGSAAGLLVPWLLHYRHGGLREQAGPHAWSLSVVPMGMGAQGVLVF
jgi:hypothetical protein